MELIKARTLDASNGIHAERRLWHFLKWLPRGAHLPSFLILSEE